MFGVLVSGCATSSDPGLVIESPKPVSSPVGEVSKPVAYPTAMASPTMKPAVKIIGQSVKSEPIELHTFGQAGVPILILGGIHGDERASVVLTKNLIELLRADSSIYSNRKVSIIPIANPDGYASNTRTNANKVDVNRNFPASNFKVVRTAGFRNGKSPGSEPETQAILAALQQVKPRLIISIHSITGGRECNNYDGPADGIAKLMSAKNGYPVTETIGYPTPGSMGSYCGQDLKIPMITLELPNSESGVNAWKRNKEALITAIRAAR